MQQHESAPIEPTSSDVIDRLGGTVETAKLCEVTPQAVTQWRREGIPRARMQFLKVVRADVFASATQASKTAAAE